MVINWKNCWSSRFLVGRVIVVFVFISVTLESISILAASDFSLPKVPILLTSSQFEQTLSDLLPSEELSTELTALWWLKNRNWQKAHDLIDPHPGSDAAWVHALLHRMEGDQDNANYWYARAGKARPNITIRQELEEMVTYFLEEKE